MWRLIMSDLDDFFNDTEIDNAATMKKFDSSKNIFNKGNLRTPCNDENVLVKWFKEKGRTLSADIAADFIVRVFLDNPTNVCTKAIKSELINQMIWWDQDNPVISLQRGFMSTLKSNMAWLKGDGWLPSNVYYDDWLSYILDEFFKDPLIGNAATMKEFVSSKNIFELKYNDGRPRTESNDKNVLVKWFKEKGTTLTADIAAEIIVRVFLDNPTNVCTKAIKFELINQMIWDPNNPVISLQRGFVSTLKPNKIWPSDNSWLLLRYYFFYWLKYMISDIVTQLDIQLNNPLPGLKSSAIQLSKSCRNDNSVILATNIATILIDDLAASLPPSWKRLKIKQNKQSENRKNNQRLSRWDTDKDLTIFLRKAVGLPSGTSDNRYRDKESRYGLAEDLYESDTKHKIFRGNVLHCVRCMDDKNEFCEMVWPFQICIFCSVAGPAYIRERIWLENTGRFKVPAQVCHTCLEPSYLFVQERNGGATQIQVTAESTLPYCNGGTSPHNFPKSAGMGKDTTVFIKYADAEHVLLQMHKNGATQGDIKLFFGNDDNNNVLIDEFCSNHPPAQKNQQEITEALKSILISKDLRSLYVACPKLKNLANFKKAINLFFDLTLKSDPTQRKEEEIWLNNIKKMDDKLFQVFKIKLKTWAKDKVAAVILKNRAAKDNAVNKKAASDNFESNKR